MVTVSLRQDALQLASTQIGIQQTENKIVMLTFHQKDNTND